MKKITTLFFLFVFLFLIIKSNESNEKSILVNGISEIGYKNVYLKFDNDSLTTKNFKQYIDENIKVMSLFNKIDNKDISYNRYLFRFEKLENNLNGYANNYIDLFGFNSEYYFKGVPIYIVEVDINNSQLDNILRKNSDIKYSLNLFGNYQ